MKILQLTNYPTSKPQHGGQLRARHIADELRGAGHDVKSVAVYVENFYEPDSEDDIAFTEQSSFWSYDLQFLSDYLSGLHAANNEHAFGALSKVSAEHRPDVIIGEQPWLLAAAKKLADNQPGVRLVYSSHNVESRLKRSVLEQTQIGQRERERLVAEIELLERNAVEIADLVIACTDADAAYYRRNAPRCREIVVAGNGVEPFTCKPGRVEAWRRFLDSPFPVFVSSAHPPNASSFWHMLAPGLTFLRPEERVLIVGGVSDLIMQMKGFDEFGMVNRDRMEVMGRMEKGELQALVRAAQVVMLPIVDGEGSNLKTAEALESGSAIVGTSKAFRGFEQAKGLTHVHIADDPLAFRRKVRELLDAPRYDGGTPIEVRSRFYWTYLLHDAVVRIGTLTT